MSILLLLAAMGLLVFISSETAGELDLIQATLTIVVGFTLMSMVLMYYVGYRDGQIDAINGKMHYKKVVDNVDRYEFIKKDE